MKITVAIPCYRSAKTLPLIVDRIRETIKNQPGYDYQIVLVNDCSPDNTFDVIRELCSHDSRIIGVNLMHNWGQAHARMATLQYIEGDIAVFMDDDGQHSIERMFDLIHKVEEGYDLVSADFSKKQEKWSKRFTSNLSAKVFKAMGKRPEGAVSSSYFAINRICIENLQNYTSPFPSFFGYLYQIAGRFTSIKFEQQKRMEGTSGYNFKKRFKLWFDSFFNFNMIPVRFAFFAGLFSVGMSFLSLVIGLFNLIFGTGSIVVGTLLVALIFMMGGILMLILGIVGEYVGKMYLVLSNQPQYVVREAINYKEKIKG